LTRKSFLKCRGAPERVLARRDGWADVEGLPDPEVLALAASEKGGPEAEEWKNRWRALPWA